ncbi:MAG: transposase [Chitinophagales bacterium]
MPNHFHLLIKIKTEQEIINNFSSSKASTFLKFRTLENLAEAEEEKLKFLSKQFSNFFSSYTQSFNKVYKRRGSLFLKNFKRKEVLSERYVRTLILYIHLNPIKHGFTKEINEWNWHSFEDFPKTYPELFEAIFSTEKDYKDLHLQKKDTFLEYDGIENDILQNY